MAFRRINPKMGISRQADRFKAFTVWLASLGLSYPGVAAVLDTVPIPSWRSEQNEKLDGTKNGSERVIMVTHAPTRQMLGRFLCQSVACS